MNTTNIARQSVAVALVSLLAGCASWNGMSHQAKATTEGAAGGAVVGAAAGGPVGAAVGAGVGGVVAHNNSDKVPTFNAPTPSSTASSNSTMSSQAASPSSSATIAANENASNRNPANPNPSKANAATGMANSTNAIVKNNDVNGNVQSGNETQDRNAVREAQRALNDKGFPAGAADGIMGPHTEQALRQFQQAQGLDTTGALDQQTMSALGVQ